MLPRSLDYFYDRQKLESLSSSDQLNEGWADSIGNVAGKGAEWLWNSKNYRTNKFAQNELQRQRLASLVARSGNESAVANLARQHAADQASDLNKLERGRTLRTLSAVTKPVSAVGGAINKGLNKLAAWKLGQTQSTNPAPTSEPTRTPLTTVVTQPTQQPAQTTQPSQTQSQPAQQSTPVTPSVSSTENPPAATWQPTGTKSLNKPTIEPGSRQTVLSLQNRNSKQYRGGTGATKRFLKTLPPSGSLVGTGSSWLSRFFGSNPKPPIKSGVNGFSDDATSANWAAKQQQARERTAATKLARTPIDKSVRRHNEKVALGKSPKVAGSLYPRNPREDVPDLRWPDSIDYRKIAPESTS